MATQIRQEINILDALLSAAGGSSATSNEIVQLDTTQYSGSPTYYFEVVADSTVSISFNVTLRRKGTSTDDATCNVPLLTTAFTLVRSSSFSPPNGQTEYVVFIDNTAGATKNVKSARIIIIQSSSPITATETQIEIGSASTITATSVPTGATNMTNPKYWKYTASNWNGTIAVWFEATFKNSTSKSSCSVALQHDDGSFGATWTTDQTLSSSSTSAVRIRGVATISLIDGRNYRIVGGANESKTGMTIYNAKIIIDSYDGTNPSNSGASTNIQGGTASSSQTSQAAAQSFKIRATSTITAIKLYLAKTSSPTDNLVVDIVSTLDGTSLATCSIAGSSLTTSLVLTTCTFVNSVSITGGSTYYIQLTRSGSRDATNYFNWGYTANIFSDGDAQTKDNNIWGPQSLDFIFYFVGQSGLTLLELQYLVSNSAFAAGTALQTNLTKWDSTEWSGVTNTYTHQLESNVNANVVELDTAGGTQLTGSQITTSGTTSKLYQSSSVTMPANGNLDTKATTNNGGVFANRILVAVSVVTTSIKTINNFAYSTAVKAWQGVAKASIKTINGVS